jgi:hypothetical protein
LTKINTTNIPRIGQIEHINLVPAQIKAPNFELILKDKSEQLNLNVSIIRDFYFRLLVLPAVSAAESRNLLEIEENS